MIRPFRAPAKNRALFGIGLSVLLIVFIPFFFRLLKLVFNKPISHSSYDLLFMLIVWLFVCGIYFCSTKIEKKPFLVWAEEQYTVDFYVLSTIVLIALNSIIAGIISLPINNPNFYNLHDQVALTDHVSKPVIFIGIVTAAFCEEFIFRGYLIPRLQLFFRNRWLPIIISAFLFSLAYIGYQTIFYVLHSFVFGALLGYHYDKYRNLKVLIIFHFLLDYCLLILVK